VTGAIPSGWIVIVAVLDPQFGSAPSAVASSAYASAPSPGAVGAVSCSHAQSALAVQDGASPDLKLDITVGFGTVTVVEEGR